MSLRLVPRTSYPQHTAPLSSAPSAPGLHDTLRANLGLAFPQPSPFSSQQQQPPALASTHPLEARLGAWRATQEALKLESLRRQFGIAEAVRRSMELKIAREGEWRPALLGRSAGVHSDILAGRDAEIGWEDVFVGDEFRPLPDFHTEMEHMLRMNW